jgi:hypothetical protein
MRERRRAGVGLDHVEKAHAVLHQARIIAKALRALRLELSEESTQQVEILISRSGFTL